MAKNLNRSALGGSGGVPAGGPVDQPTETPKLESDLNAIVEESKATIAQEGLKKMRGRPRKDGSAPTQKPVASVSSSPAQIASAAPVGTADLTKYLEPPLLALSSIPAKRTGCKELALDKEEAKALASSLNDLMNAFIPDVNQLSPKAAASIGFGLTVSTIFLTKAQIYADYREKNIPKDKPVKKSENKPEENSDSVFPEEKINALDHFRPRTV